MKVAQSCLTLCDPMDYIVHGILQARILEWVAFPFSRGSSQPKDRTQVSRIAGGFYISWATKINDNPKQFSFVKKWKRFPILKIFKNAFWKSIMVQSEFWSLTNENIWSVSFFLMFTCLIFFITCNLRNLLFLHLCMIVEDFFLQENFEGTSR